MSRFCLSSRFLIRKIWEFNPSESPFALHWYKLKRFCSIWVKSDRPRNHFFLVRLKSPFSFFKIDVVLNSHNCGSLPEQISGTWNEFERYEKPRFPCKNISNTFLIEISTRFHLMMISGRKQNKKKPVYYRVCHLNSKKIITRFFKGLLYMAGFELLMVKNTRLRPVILSIPMCTQVISCWKIF